MKALLDRKTQEADSLTVAIANGVAISMSAESARKWQEARGIAAPAQPMDATTLGLMVRQFPGSFTVH